MFKLVLIAGVYLLCNTLWAMHHHPELASEQPRAALSWFSLWLFVVTAWWCAGNEYRIRILLGLAFVSLVASLLLEFDWAQWRAILLEGRRSGVGFTAAAAGLYTATALVGWLLIATPWNRRLQSRVTFSCILMAWMAVLLALLEVIVISQSRTTWLALILVGMLLAGFTVYSRRSTIKAEPRRRVVKLIVLACVISIGLLGVVFVNGEVILERFFWETRMLEPIPLREWPELTHSSVGIRLLLDQYGIEKLLERPFLGWGPGTVVTHQFAIADGFPTLAEQPDLHNSVLALLVRLGLFGGLIYLAGAARLGRGVWKAYRSHAMSQRMFLFLLGTAGLTLLASLMNFRWTHIDFRFFWLLLAGIAFSYTLIVPPSGTGR